MNKMFFAAAAACLVATPAAAEITWTPAAGGFVGKGDVQVPLGWNNKMMQDNAASVVFAYSVARSYNVPCYHMEPDFIGEGKNKVKILVPVYKDFKRQDNIAATVQVDYTKGKTGQMTGYFLASIAGSAGDVTPTCPGGWELDTEDEAGLVQNLLTSDATLTANGVPLPTYFGN